MVYLDQILLTYYLFILTLFRHWYAKGDDTLLSIILVGRGILVKMLITLNGMFCMYFDHICHAYPLHWYNIIILNLEK